MSVSKEIATGGFSRIIRVVAKKPKYFTGKYSKIYNEDVKRNIKQEIEFCKEIVNKDIRGIVNIYGIFEDTIFMEECSYVWSFEYKHEWISYLTSGIKFIHDKGYYHGDICPDNIVIDRRMNPKLCDFGRTYKAGTGLYLCRSLYKGEVIKGKEHLADIYSLGLTIWALANKAEPLNPYNKEEKYLDPDNDTINFILKVMVINNKEFSYRLLEDKITA